MSSNTQARFKATGGDLWRRTDKINAEFFFFTYGALVVQLIRDLEDYGEVNKQLDKMGYNMGQRLIEDLLSRTGNGRCKDFTEVGEFVSKIAFQALFGTIPQLVIHSDQGSLAKAERDLKSEVNTKPRFSLVFDENPLGEFVELPEEALKGGLVYGKIIEGAIRGSLEMVQMAVTVDTVSDTLKGDEKTEFLVTFNKYLEEEMPPGDE